MTDDRLSWIMKRRSIRTYTDAPVSDEQVDHMLRAAMAAPSADDIRPWGFVVVRDAGRRTELAAVHPWSAMCIGAPLVVAVLGYPEVSDHWVEDCSAATENLLLAAASLDLGAVWVAVYPHPVPEDKVRRILGIPDQFRVLCLVPIGHPIEPKAARTRYQADRVHYETFGNQPKAD